MKTKDRWYENATFYAIDVEAFADGNGDGVGDFAGLTDRLDYLEELGSTVCGCCRSTRRRTATTATTWPTTTGWTPPRNPR
jgi:hypothetical protein